MTDPAAVLRELWLRHREIVLGRMALVCEALGRLAEGGLTEVDREDAMREAHRLRGVLGTYGFPEGSILAGEAEDLLAGVGGAGADADGGPGQLRARLEAYASSL